MLINFLIQLDRLTSGRVSRPKLERSYERSFVVTCAALYHARRVSYYHSSSLLTRWVTGTYNGLHFPAVRRMQYDSS